MILNFNSFKQSNDYVCPLCVDRYLNSKYEQSIKESLSFKITSLQVNVPMKGCINACKSCIARISNDNNLFKDLSKTNNFDQLYLKKLEEIKSQGCKSLILTSDQGEPMQNKKFIEKINQYNNLLNNWYDIEIQTTGVLLSSNIPFLKNNNIKIVSLSIFDIFDENNNFDIITIKDKLKFDIKEICHEIRNNGIILRLSLNLVKNYDEHTIKELFDKIAHLNPHQVTMKNLWHTEENNAINKWIKSNKASNNFLQKVSNYLEIKKASKINSFRYYYQGRTIWLIDNCMLGNYIILRPDAQLYRSWDSLAPMKLD